MPGIVHVWGRAKARIVVEDSDLVQGYREDMGENIIMIISVPKRISRNQIEVLSLRCLHSLFL